MYVWGDGVLTRFFFVLIEYFFPIGRHRDWRSRKRLWICRRRFKPSDLRMRMRMTTKKLAMQSRMDSTLKRPSIDEKRPTNAK
jgi:hypothetical protein